MGNFFDTTSLEDVDISKRLQKVDITSKTNLSNVICDLISDLICISSTETCKNQCPSGDTAASDCRITCTITIENKTDDNSGTARNCTKHLYM